MLKENIIEIPDKFSVMFFWFLKSKGCENFLERRDHG